MREERKTLSDMEKADKLSDIAIVLSITTIVINVLANLDKIVSFVYLIRFYLH